MANARGSVTTTPPLAPSSSPLLATSGPAHLLPSTSNSPVLGPCRQATEDLDDGVRALIHLRRAAEAASAAALHYPSGGIPAMHAAGSYTGATGTYAAGSSPSSSPSLWPDVASHGSPSLLTVSHNTTAPAWPLLSETAARSTTSTHSATADLYNAHNSANVSTTSHSAARSTGNNASPPAASSSPAIVYFNKWGEEELLPQTSAMQPPQQQSHHHHHHHHQARTSRSGSRVTATSVSSPVAQPHLHSVRNHHFQRATPLAPPLALVPPFRFALVEDGIYRGAYPVLRNFPFLEGLHLKTIVQLTPEEATYDLASWAAAHGIEVVHIQAERFKGEAQLPPEDLGHALKVLLNVERHPVYLHCLDGRQVSGLVVMGLRKLMYWNIHASHAEYRRFAKSTDDEVAFVADYTGPIEVPVRTPPWLWGGSWADASGHPRPHLHHQIKLKFPAVPAPKAIESALTLLSPDALSGHMVTALPVSPLPGSAVNGLLLPPPATNAMTASLTPRSSGGRTRAHSPATGILATPGPGGGPSASVGSRYGTPGSGPALSNSPHGSSTSSLAPAAPTAPPGSLPAPFTTTTVAAPSAGGAVMMGSAPSNVQPVTAPAVYIDVNAVAPQALYSSPTGIHPNAQSGARAPTAAAGNVNTSALRRRNSGVLDGESAPNTAKGSANTSHGNSTNTSVVGSMLPLSVERGRGSTGGGSGGGAGVSIGAGGGVGSAVTSGQRLGSSHNTESDAPVWLQDSADSIAALTTHPLSHPHRAPHNSATYDNLALAVGAHSAARSSVGTGMLNVPTVGATTSALAAATAAAAAATSHGATGAAPGSATPAARVPAPTDRVVLFGPTAQDGSTSRKVKRRASL